jgi:hypothetical protein
MKRAHLRPGGRPLSQSRLGLVKNADASPDWSDQIRVSIASITRRVRCNERMTGTHASNHRGSISATATTPSLAAQRETKGL